jgi:hypothetical protein
MRPKCGFLGKLIRFGLHPSQLLQFHQLLFFVFFCFEFLLDLRFFILRVANFQLRRVRQANFYLDLKLSRGESKTLVF